MSADWQRCHSTRAIHGAASAPSEHMYGYVDLAGGGKRGRRQVVPRVDVKGRKEKVVTLGMLRGE